MRSVLDTYLLYTWAVSRSPVPAPEHWISPAAPPCTQRTWSRVQTAQSRSQVWQVLFLHNWKWTLKSISIPPLTNLTHLHEPPCILLHRHPFVWPESRDASETKWSKFAQTWRWKEESKAGMQLRVPETTSVAKDPSVRYTHLLQHRHQECWSSSLNPLLSLHLLQRWAVGETEGDVVYQTQVDCIYKHPC